MKYYKRWEKQEKYVINKEMLWTNWINYYVYQTTPYDINDVENE